MYNVLNVMSTIVYLPLFSLPVSLIYFKFMLYNAVSYLKTCAINFFKKSNTIGIKDLTSCICYR